MEITRSAPNFCCASMFVRDKHRPNMGRSMKIPVPVASIVLVVLVHRRTEYLYSLTIWQVSSQRSQAQHSVQNTHAANRNKGRTSAIEYFLVFEASAPQRDCMPSCVSIPLSLSYPAPIVALLLLLTINLTGLGSLSRWLTKEFTPF